MTKCTFCGKEYDLHKGVTLVHNDGVIDHFCSSKCRKTKEMKKRRVRWISKTFRVKKDKKKKSKK